MRSDRPIIIEIPAPATAMEGNCEVDMNTIVERRMASLELLPPFRGTLGEVDLSNQAPPKKYDVPEPKAALESLMARVLFTKPCALCSAAVNFTAGTPHESDWH